MSPAELAVLIFILMAFGVFMGTLAWASRQHSRLLPRLLFIRNLAPRQDRDITVKNRDIVGKLMNPRQIAEAQRLAYAWRPKSSP